MFTKALSTSCRALGYTPEAATMARMKSFSMVKNYGLISLLLTVSSCDECGFCVCLYTKSQDWVS